MASDADDRRLGLDRDISRRDFLNGVALGVGAVAAGWRPFAACAADAIYPPALTGLRGQHAGSFEIMHALRDGSFWSGAGAPVPTGESYDLVVVGAGISGLAAAFLYRQCVGGRVLLLDDHDDFGGHAKRNEFVAANGRRLIGYGGSQSLQSPSYFSPAVRALLRDVGIDLERFRHYYDRDWYRRRGLGEAVFFCRERFGADRLVVKRERAAHWVPATPLSATAQRQLIELIDAPRDYLAGLERAAKLERLARITYERFLVEHAGVGAEVLAYLHDTTAGYFGVGIDATSALDARANGNPGFDGMDLGDAVQPSLSPSGRLLARDPDPYIFHFPDGNAGVARALVRALIPGALPGGSMEELVTHRVDYARLDRAGQAVRLRLRSPVVRVRHQGEPARARGVEISYVQDGALRTVSAGHVVLACWHRVIPYLTDELPSAQVSALNDQHKVPLIYANVLVRNWRAFERLGIRGFDAPGAFWSDAALDFPVSIGRYRCADRPDDPVLLHLSKVVLGGASGTPARAQADAGRRLLVGFSFAEMEREIRDLLARGLAGGGFDPAGDIEAITINRWAHGYAYEYMRPWDGWWPDGPLPIELARRPWGRIAIANSDSGAYAYAHSAIDQAARAVGELLGARAHLAPHAVFPGPPPARLGLA